MAKKQPGHIFAFAHIQKAAGTTILSLLRRHFGLRHMDVRARLGWRYTREDLAADLRLNPFTQSISSHWLRPFIDYGKFADRLVWYAMIREPARRYISHYQHQIEKMNITATFDEWMMNKMQTNWQVQFLAGEQDLEAAKQILETRFRCVGIVERFNESLLLIRHHLGLRNFQITFERPRNTAKSGRIAKMIQDSMDTYRDRILENNALDIELYKFVTGKLYPRQVERYGPQRLSQDLETEFVEYKSRIGDEIRERANSLVQKALYRQIVLIRRGLAHLRDMPEIRR